MCQHAKIDAVEGEKRVSALDTPPPGHHYNPYTRQWSPNLTEAQIKTMWPYATQETTKEKPVEPIADWIEETLSIAGIEKSQKDTLTEPPDRSGPMPAFADVERPLDPSLFTNRYVFAPDAAEKPSHELEVVGQMVNNMLSSADMVVLPEHYARFKIEPIRFICENNLNFFQGNIIKYVLRHDAKNGLEDLKKALRYLEMFIKFVEGDENWWRKC